MYLEWFRQYKLDDTFVLCTVIEGDSQGAHAVFRNGKRIAEEGGFPDSYMPPAGDRRRCFCDRSGTDRIFCEVPGREKNAVICGGGYVAGEVRSLLLGLCFGVTVLDDRPEFCEEAAREGSCRVLTGDFGENLEKLSPDGNTWFIIMTRGHRFDMICLEYALRHEFAYVGMMSSRMRVRAAKELMLERGIPEAKLNLLHAPIGLSIGAETPAEIAVSVAAEIIRELRQKEGGDVPSPVLDAAEKPGDKIAALIVSRKGPVPRKPGTRMLIHSDGTCTGTIGGGCFEAAVIRKARELLWTGEKKISTLITADLTGADNPEEGVACGGEMEVFLEKI